jgi:hypothetical protein
MLLSKEELLAKLESASAVYLDSKTNYAHTSYEVRELEVQ